LGAVLFVGILVLGWGFAADHEQLVTIKTPISSDAEVSLWLALLLAVALGAIAVGSIAAYQMARMGLLARRYRGIIRKLEAEVHELRNLPLDEDAPAPAKPTPELEGAAAARRALGRGA
jgi:hypothetical protein